MDGTGILVGGEFIGLLVDDDGFFELRQQQDSPGRRGGRGVKETVIAARVQADQGRRGKAAEPVGFKPFPRKRQVQPGADALIEANDFWFHLQTPARYGGESTGAVHVYKDCLSSDMLRRNPTTFGEFRKGNGRLQIASRRRRD